MPGSIFLKNDRFCVKSITDYMDPYFKLKPPDCYLYAEDGYKFDIHKVCLQIFFSQFTIISKIVDSAQKIANGKGSFNNCVDKRRKWWVSGKSTRRGGGQNWVKLGPRSS